MTLPELSVLAWIALAIGGISVGVSKTALPGSNTLGVALFAAALPARASTGTLLVLLIVGDAIALLMYRHHARLRTLVPLIPAVVVGLVAGSVFLAVADDAVTRRIIGAILLVLIAVTLWRRRRTKEDAPAGGRLMAASYGAMGGFTTMVANAGGPVMTMYFVAMRLPMKEFLGTAAWFFAAVNLVKLPFSIGLGVLTADSLLVDLVLLPTVLIGAGLGWLLVRRMNQRVFTLAVTVLTVVGAVYLLI
ncbi:MAG: sulfite exporter TauE/SafE family protein [Microbacterium sp.]